MARRIADTESANRIDKFSDSSGKGKLSLAMSALTLDSVANGEAHMTMELTIRDRIYTTGVTFFGANPGSYSTSIPLHRARIRASTEAWRRPVPPTMFSVLASTGEQIREKNRAQ